MWLYYWLAAHGINPFKDVKNITVPPPQMVANMRVGNMDGFCVGEPWNNRAIVDKIGFTAVTTTQDIWVDHPEKVLGTTAEWTCQKSEHGARHDRGDHRRRRWIDASLANKQKTAETVAEQGLCQHRRT
jgi:nitrate/nitrite transport system substrate-binding protein